MNDTRDWCGCGLQVVRYIVTIIIICQVKDARSKSALADAAIYGRPNEFIGRADVLNQCAAIYKSLRRETAGQKRAKQTIKTRVRPYTAACLYILQYCTHIATTRSYIIRARLKPCIFPYIIHY